MKLPTNLGSAALLLQLLTVQFLGLQPALALDSLAEAEDRREPLAPALLAAETSPLSSLRLRAARALGRIQRPEGVAPLLVLLNDPKLSVRLESAFALGQLGWDASFAGVSQPQVVAALSPLLTDKNPRIRATVTEALGKIGLENTPTLIAPALVDSSPSVRAQALMALYRHRLVLKLRNPTAAPPELPAVSVASVLALSQDPHEQVKRNAAYVLARVKISGAPEVLTAATRLAQAPETWVRYFAVVALGKQAQATPEITLAAIHAAQDSHSFIRVAALQALLALKSPLPDSLELTLSKDPSQAVRSAVALGTVHAPLLETLLLDSSTGVHADALRTLVALVPPQASPWITQGLGDPNWVIRQAAVEAGSAALTDPKEKLALLELARKDTDVRVRASALDAYTNIPGPEAFQALRDGLKSSALSERGTAAGALASRPEPEVASAAWDCYLLSADEKWVEVREGLISVLSALPGDATSALLQLAISDPAPSVSGAAIRALTSRGLTGLPAAPPLVLSFSPERELKFKRNPKIHLLTNRGEILLELFPRAAPIHVANLVGFVAKGGYDGLPIHRVVPNFVIQGGDPDGSGWGGAGFALRAEINRLPFERGTLGMPRSTGFDTGGVQFFITHVPTPNLDGQYTVFGQVLKGMKIVDRTEVGDTVTKAWVEH